MGAKKAPNHQISSFWRPLGDILGTFWDILGNFSAHFGSPERTWKHIRYKRGAASFSPTPLGPKNHKNWGFLVPQKFQNRCQNGIKKGKKKTHEKNHFCKHFLMKMYHFPYLSSIERWRFRSRGSSILTLSKLYLISSVGTIASWFGGWKIIKFRPKNGVKS